jgi:hypothetical protein
MPASDHNQAGKDHNLKVSLEGRRLRKKACLKFEPTDDLANYLHLDVKSEIVQIFEHTRFLKEYLISIQADDSTTNSSKRYNY